MDVSDEAVERATRIRRTEGGGLAFWCPACDHAHHVKVEGPGAWEFNNDLLRPTLSPSILVQGKYWKGKGDADPLDPLNWPEVHCHSFLRNGNIEYCSDSKHALAGQTVPLPIFP